MDGTFDDLAREDQLHREFMGAGVDALTRVNAMFDARPDPGDYAAIEQAADDHLRATIKGASGSFDVAVGDTLRDTHTGRLCSVVGWSDPKSFDHGAETVFNAVSVCWSDDQSQSVVPANSLRRVVALDAGLFPASDLHDKPIPSREWLVRGWIPGSTVTMLGGDGGTGKSLVALQLAVAVATGGAWLGMPIERNRALFLSAEDDRDELHRRVADVARTSGVGLDALGGLLLCSLAGKDALLATLERDGTLSKTRLFETLDDSLYRHKPGVMVLDTLADLFPGNENDRAQARQFIGMLRGLAIRHQCAVVLLAHPSLTGINSGTGTSGSTGWNNSVRSRLFLSRVAQDGYEPNPDARVLRTMKSNYGRTGGEIALTWQDGVFVSDAPVTGLDRMAASAKAERVFLHLLREFTDQGRRVNSKGGANYAPSLFTRHPKAEGVSKRAFHSAMEALLTSKKIVVAHEGPPSRQVSFIQEAPKDGVQSDVEGPSSPLHPPQNEGLIPPTEAASSPPSPPLHPPSQSHPL